MKTTIKRCASWVVLLTFISQFALADYAPTPVDTGGEDPQTGGPLTTLVTYLGNLGRFLGYDLDSSAPPIPKSDLIGYSPQNAYSLHKVFENLVYYSMFAALPVNSFESTLSTFTPNDFGDLNKYANFTFSNPSPFSSSNPDTLSVVKDIDQTYAPQNDPINQANLNIIGTPDDSFCSASTNNNKCLSQTDILSNILKDITSSEGILPGADNFYNKEVVLASLSQLNSNTLIAPLVYNTKADEGEASKGLPKGNQEQQAADFIRYATGSSLILPSISRKDYDQLWATAFTDRGNVKKNTDMDGTAAQKALAQYLIALRIYAAQSSVATSNLYAILSKRIPQQGESNSQNATSQALNEFKMATWRLRNPDPQAKDDQQWVDQINSASPATVQKEIAVLLSEINYQMYLSRQQQERLLLTNSMILMQTLSQNKPSPPSAEDLITDDTATSEKTS